MARLLTAVLMLLLPAGCETWHAAGRRGRAALLCGGMACLMWLSFPPWLRVPGLCWCAACAGMVWPEGGDRARRGYLWLGLCALFGMGLLLLTGLRARRGVDEALADALIGALQRSDDPGRWLIQAWQTGLARVPGGSLYPYLRGWDGRYYLDGEAVTQLMNSLRLSLQTQATALLPMACCTLVGLPALLAALCGGAEERRTCGYSTVKPFSLWRAPSLLVSALILTGLMRYVAETRFGAAFTGLCSALGSLLLMLEGAALLWYVTDRHSNATGRGRWLATAGIGAMALLLPAALEMLGVVDYLFCLREREEE